MPLSEHEQRQLEQIEQALYADYPKLAQSVRSKDPRVHFRRRVLQAGVGFVIGVGLLLAGVISAITPIGVGGFVVMLACAMWALASWRHAGAVSGRARGVGRRPMQPRGSARMRRRGMKGQPFMERLEERWRRRQEGGF